MTEPSCLFDALEPRRKKLAIIGFASSSRLLAPFADQAWEVWGENQLYRFIPRATRWFELHPHEGPRSYLADMVPGTDYVSWLRACPMPIYMVTRHPEIPNSIEYPLRQMVETFQLDRIRPDLGGKGYFHSTIDFMLALAIAEGFEEIGVWGVDMAHDTEYVRQKPSGSFWLGVAHGRGIRVTIPQTSALLNNCGYRYGYDPEEGFELLRQLESRRRALVERQGQLQGEMHMVMGLLQENDHWTMYAKNVQRGAMTLPGTATQF